MTFCFSFEVFVTTEYQRVNGGGGGGAVLHIHTQEGGGMKTNLQLRLAVYFTYFSTQNSNSR